MNVSCSSLHRVFAPAAPSARSTLLLLGCYLPLWLLGSGCVVWIMGMPGRPQGHLNPSYANSRTQLTYIDVLITGIKNAPGPAHLQRAPLTQSQHHPLPTQSGFPQWGRLLLPTGHQGKQMKTTAMNKKSTFRVHSSKEFLPGIPD